MSLKHNRIAQALCLVLCLLLAAVFTLPMFRLTSTAYTKRYANTFVGDERYLAALEEVKALLPEYGDDAEITENVIERVNSKGVTTSIVTFTILQTVHKSAWSLLVLKGTAPAGILIAILVLTFLSAALTLVSGNQITGRKEKEKDKEKLRFVRRTACLMTLAALVLIPVLAAAFNLFFTRQPGLYQNGLMDEYAAYLPLLDDFLYSGAMGEKTADMLKGLNAAVGGLWWLSMPLLFGMLLCQIDRSEGCLMPVLSRGFLYFFVIVFSILVLYPFFVMFITAFRNYSETTDMYFCHLLPSTWVWSNLTDIASRGVFRYLLNSIMLSSGATVLALLCGIPAAYAMARMRFRGRKAFLGFVIMSQMFAPVVLLVGISSLMSTFKLNDSILGLMLINAAFNQAFAIWLLRGTFVSISPEMEQAACIDGCNTVQALLRILLPMAAPGIVTTLIFVFINAWNEYTISTVLISTTTRKPITVGITQFSSFNMIEWQYLFAASLLATIPVVILFMCIEKHLVSGLTSGGVKG